MRKRLVKFLSSRTNGRFILEVEIDHVQPGGVDSTQGVEELILNLLGTPCTVRSVDR